MYHTNAHTFVIAQTVTPGLSLLLMLTCQSLDFQPCILKCLFKIRDLGRAFLASSKRGVVSAGSTYRCSYGNIEAPRRSGRKM